MMRYMPLFGLVAVLWLALVACQMSPVNAQPRSVPAVSTPAPVFLPLVSAGQQTTSSPTVAVAPSLSPTVIVPSTVVTAWLTYTDSTGIAFEYPDSWTLKDNRKITEQLVFYPSGSTINYYGVDDRIAIAIQKIPLAERDSAYPYNPKPVKDGWYSIYWATPITIPSTTGFLYVSSRDVFDSADLRTRQWDQGAELTARYYSETYELLVSFWANFDDEGTVLAQHNGLAATVAERYPIFEHMVKSVHFFAPLAPGN